MPQRRREVFCATRAEKPYMYAWLTAPVGK